MWIQLGFVITNHVVFVAVGALDLSKNEIVYFLLFFYSAQIEQGTLMQIVVLEGEGRDCPKKKATQSLPELLHRPSFRSFFRVSCIQNDINI